MDLQEAITSYLYAIEEFSFLTVNTTVAFGGKCHEGCDIARYLVQTLNCTPGQMQAPTHQAIRPSRTRYEDPAGVSHTPRGGIFNSLQKGDQQIPSDGRGRGYWRPLSGQGRTQPVLACVRRHHG